MVRILLWTAILAATGLPRRAGCPASQSPRAPTPPPALREAASDPPQLTDLLEGYWTTDDSRFGLAGQRVDADQLTRHWTSTGPEPLPDSSSLDRELAALLATHATATRTSDLTVYERSLPNLRMRGVFSSQDPPRLRLFQIAVRDGAGWERSARSSPLRMRGGTGSRSRSSRTLKGHGCCGAGRLMSTYPGKSSSPAPQASFVQGLQKKGWTVDRADFAGGSDRLAGSTRPGPAACDGLLGRPGPGTLRRCGGGRTVRGRLRLDRRPLPARPPRLARLPPSPPAPVPSHLLIILKTASEQELP